MWKEGAFSTLETWPSAGQNEETLSQKPDTGLQL